MNFFQQLAELSPNLDLTLRLMMKGGKLTVAVMPATDEDLKPLTVSGTAQELDEGFIDTIRKPIELVSGLTSNADEFIESVKKTEKPAGKKETKALKTNTAKEEKKETPPASTEQPSLSLENKESEPTPPKFDKEDRVMFFNPGIHRGKLGSVINEQPNEVGQIVVQFDFDQEHYTLPEKDFRKYDKPAANASQPDSKPAPPKPGPPKPAPATA